MTRVKRDDVSAIFISCTLSHPGLDGLTRRPSPCNYITNLARSTHSPPERWVREFKTNLCSQTRIWGPTKTPLLCSTSLVPTPSHFYQRNACPPCQRDELGLCESFSLSPSHRIPFPFPGPGTELWPWVCAKHIDTPICPL